MLVPREPVAKAADGAPGEVEREERWRRRRWRQRAWEDEGLGGEEPAVTASGGGDGDVSRVESRR